MNANEEPTPGRSAHRGRPATVTAVIVVIVMGLAAAAGALWWMGSRSSGPEGSRAVVRRIYFCPMHRAYTSDRPGNCPICNMTLVPLDTASPSTAPSRAAAGEAGGAGDATGAGGPGGRGSGDRPGAPAGRASAADGTRHQHVPPRATGGTASVIRIAPERQQQIGVRFAAAAMKPAVVEIRAVGKVAFDETRIAHVHTKVNGWIEDVFVNFVGAQVHRGQPLFTIYSPDLVAGQQEYLLALRAREELGGSSFSRIADGSRSLVVEARRRLELWDMPADQIAALEKRGDVARTVTITSPVNGIVTERAVYHHGRYVSPDLDLYTIVDLSRVWVQADVYEYEMPHVRVGQAAEATLPYDAERKPLAGKVAFIGASLDPMTRTVPVRLEFANPDLSLKPETFVNVTLQRRLGPRLVVPKDAVMDTGKTQYVFVDRGDGYLEPREVTAGAEVAEGRVIARGLTEGERVVTAANFILDSESRLKGAFDAMTPPSRAEAPAQP